MNKPVNYDNYGTWEKTSNLLPMDTLDLCKIYVWEQEKIRLMENVGVFIFGLVFKTPAKKRPTN